MEKAIDFSREIPLGWYPWKILSREKLIRWCYIGDKRFTESFFEETISSRLHLAENISFAKNSSPVESLSQISTGKETATPAAFIFHISRCGSTLLSQALSLDDRIITLSEVPAFDQLLDYIRKEKTGFPVAKNLVHGMVKALGRKRNLRENFVFFKLDSWHIFYYELLRKIYPDVPFLFLYRRPDEVFRSHLRRLGMHMAPELMDSALFGIDEEMKAEPQRYIAGVLNRYLQEFFRIAQIDRLVTLADYKEGMETITMRLLERAGIITDRKWHDEMITRLQFHSKFPDQKFTGDPSPEIEQPALQHAMEAYEVLEKLRGNKKKK